MWLFKHNWTDGPESCPLATESNTMALAFEKRKSFIERSITKEKRRKSLRSVSCIQGQDDNLKG